MEIFNSPRRKTMVILKKEGLGLFLTHNYYINYSIRTLLAKGKIYEISQETQK
jgi:hypothetical protein